MNIEQGMSKEEGRGLSEEMAATNAKNHKQRYTLTHLRIQNQSCHSSRFFVSFRGATPSSFDIPCSTFFGSRGGWRQPFG